MKAFQLTTSIVILLVLIGCEDKSESPDMSVDRYVDLLAAGKYDHWELPDFTSRDIPKLLTYRDETQLITGFPVNGISSSLTPECSLGMYILWTVESIRARSIGSKFLVGSFPSQNPVIKNRENSEYLDQSAQLQQEVANFYYDWWESNKDKNFAEFDEIDPLADTDYRWH